MGIPLQALQLRPIAMKLMISMATILMLAYLATNIQSKTYLVQTASKDHGYGSHSMESVERRPSPLSLSLTLSHGAGSDYGADYQAATPCLIPGPPFGEWSVRCPNFNPNSNPPYCTKKREVVCNEVPRGSIPSSACNIDGCEGIVSAGLTVEQYKPFPCNECAQWRGRGKTLDARLVDPTIPRFRSCFANVDCQNRK